MLNSTKAVILVNLQLWFEKADLSLAAVWNSMTAELKRLKCQICAGKLRAEPSRMDGSLGVAFERIFRRLYSSLLISFAPSCLHNCTQHSDGIGTINRAVWTTFTRTYDLANFKNVPKSKIRVKMYWVMYRMPHVFKIKCSLDLTVAQTFKKSVRLSAPVV